MRGLCRFIAGCARFYYLPSLFFYDVARTPSPLFPSAEGRLVCSLSLSFHRFIDRLVSCHVAFVSLQHVHTCLLQQSSSAKKAPPPAKPATAAATPAPRTPGNDHDKDKDKRRYAGAGGSGYGNRSRGGVGETWPSVLGPGQGQDGRTDADAVDSPRSMSTRVSLQGVFSPQVGSKELPVER